MSGITHWTNGASWLQSNSRPCCRSELVLIASNNPYIQSFYPSPLDLYHTLELPLPDPHHPRCLTAPEPWTPRSPPPQRHAPIHRLPQPLNPIIRRYPGRDLCKRMFTLYGIFLEFCALWKNHCFAMTPVGSNCKISLKECSGTASLVSN